MMSNNPAMRVLIVEDDVVMRLYLSQLALRQGYEVVTAENGQEALSILQTENVSIVLSDWNMPVMDGPDFCRIVRSIQKDSYVYIILLTGRQEEADFLEGMQSGADDLLVKPVNALALGERLRVASRIVTLQQSLQQRNTMLTRTNTELADANSRLKRDLLAAAKLQRSLLPESSRTIGGVHFESIFVPSEIISGDVYNFFPLEDGSVGLYALDVAGHGVPAALTSVTLSRFLTPESFSAANREGISEPDAIVTELNRRFQAQEDVTDYFTMICGVFNTDSQRLQFCQAGHPSPILMPAHGEATTVGKGGFPVGMLPGADYSVVDLQLTQGDRLFLYSDGVTECYSPNEEQYGEERLKNFLRRHKKTPLDRLTERLKEDLCNWQQSDVFADDISIVAMEMIS